MNSINLLNSRVATAFYGRFNFINNAQEAVIEPLVNGRNIVLCSGTGSGKTEAVMAPIVSRYWEEALEYDELFIIYICPTKALVNDLEKRLELPLSYLGLRIGIRHGDRDDLKNNKIPHVLLTTPESFDVLLFKKETRILTVKAIILDEVHILYNNQRGLQLSILLNRLQILVQRKIQWAALSATIGNMSFIRDFIIGSNSQADFFSYPSERRIDCYITHIKNLYIFQQLIEKLIDNSKLLIFTDTRKECERLASFLNGSDFLSYRLFVHYSSLSRGIRVETEKKFADSSSAVCIATSTLELGIDIGDIDAIIIWGIPNNIESFMQRIGRGNRRSQKINVICLVPDTSETVFLDLIKFYILTECAINGNLSQENPYKLYGSVVQQSLSIIAANEGRFVKSEELMTAHSHLPYINKFIMDSILAELCDKEFILKHNFKYSYAAYEKLFQIKDLRLIYGNFPLGTKMVRLMSGKKDLGEVPEINLVSIKQGSIVRFQGKYWCVKKVSTDLISLEPTSNKKNSIDFIYPSSKKRVDSYIINQVWFALHNDINYKEYYDSNLYTYIISRQKLIRDNIPLLSIPYIRYNDKIKYYTFGSMIVNRAIALFMDCTEFEADDISLTLSSPLSWNTIPENPMEYQIIFSKLFDNLEQQTIFQMQLPLELQLDEYLQYWLNNKTIEEILKRLKISIPLEINLDLVKKIDFYSLS